MTISIINPLYFVVWIKESLRFYTQNFTRDRLYIIIKLEGGGGVLYVNGVTTSLSDSEDERDENECIFDIHLRVMYCNADEFRFVLVYHYARMRDNS